MLHPNGITLYARFATQEGTKIMADGLTDINAKPTEDVSVREMFGIDSDMKIKGFAERGERVPEIDSTYKFDPDTTLAILAGLATTAA